MMHRSIRRGLATGFTLLAGGVGYSLSGCNLGGAASPTASTNGAPVVKTAGASSVTFRDAIAESGITYEWKAQGKRPLNILQTIGNGIAFLDFDRDGSLDILCVGPAPALYKGDGKGHFTDVSAGTGIGKLKGHFLGVAVGDVDNDGWDDLYISGYGEGRLLKNNGGKGFTDVTASYSLKPQPWGTSAGFADLDGDGYLDLYVANYADFTPKTVPQMCDFQTANGKVPSSCGPKLYKGIKGTLWHNMGGTRFADVTIPWGANAHSGRGLGVAFSDFDNSGRVSMAVANDEAPGDLFQNMGKAKLTNNAVPLNVAYDRDGNVHGGMGVDWGDYNNDGKPDLFVATFRNEIKCLYRNEGDAFSDVAYASGIGQGMMPGVAFGAKFLDADNDGWLDILLANGHVQDNIKLIENTDYPQRTQFFHNMGEKSGRFEDATDSSGIGALRPIVGRGLAIGDYDNDGKMDAMLVDSEGKPFLLHNESAGTNNWVGFQIADAGKGVNRNGYGTRITLTLSSGEKRVRDCQTAGSYLSASDARVHFGLGKESVKRVMVRWPNGKTETWPGAKANKYFMLSAGKEPR